uniref:Uncharacterized protein n=1 Tax=Arundo donax TaxID=35708 RepID=A0A0A9G2X2_ARUDO
MASGATTPCLASVRTLRRHPCGRRRRADGHGFLWRWLIVSRSTTNTRHWKNTCMMELKIAHPGGLGPSSPNLFQYVGSSPKVTGVGGLLMCPQQKMMVNYSNSAPLD